MKTYVTYVACLSTLLSLVASLRADAIPPSSEPTSLIDSVGIEKKGGKRFILHRVDEGQTLFAIARRYGRSVAELRAANADLGESVKYDQVVRIPIPDDALSKKEAKAIDKAIRKEEKEQKRDAEAGVAPADKPTPARPDKATKDGRKTDDPARAGIHVVEPGQTLYSLAVRYGVPQADLRKWNNLPSNNVLIGQALIVSEKAYVARTPSSPTLTAAARTPDTPARTTRPAESKPATGRRDQNATPSDSKSERPAPTIDNRRSDGPRPGGSPASNPRNDNATTPTTAGPKPPEAEVEAPRAGNDAPMPTRGRRMSTSGIAEMIEGTDGSGKYLALHRTAPIGTLVQVRNEFNNQSVWVKVVGRLPNTGVNDKILIKLSTQAFAKLSPEDRRFRAEVSYIVR